MIGDRPSRKYSEELDPSIWVSSPYGIWPTRIVRLNLAPQVRSLCCYNGSICRHRGRLCFCFRSNWIGGNLNFCELDDKTLEPAKIVPLWPDHTLCSGAREDPRLFEFRGKLMVSFAGVQFRGSNSWVNQLLLSLTNRRYVEHTWAPDFAGKQLWEKNWGFFSFYNELFAVYSIRPHRILYLDEPWINAEPYGDDHHGPPAIGCDLMRGGAPPVLHNGEYYSFYHGVRAENDGRRIYYLGVYTFEDRPPFAPKRSCRQPLMLPRCETRPRDVNPSVLYCCGAVFDGSEWLLSAGYHDWFCDVLSIKADDVERVLELV